VAEEHPAGAKSLAVYALFCGTAEAVPFQMVFVQDLRRGLGVVFSNGIYATGSSDSCWC
jgi:hypothetical protein